MNSIRGRLTIGLLLGTLAVAAACGAVLYWTTRTKIVARYDATLLSKARALGTVFGSRPSGLPPPPGSALPTMAEFGPGELPEFFQVWGATGTTVGRSQSLGTRDLIPRPSAAGLPAFRDVMLPGGGTGRVVVVKYVATGRPGDRGRPPPRGPEGERGGDRRGREDGPDRDRPPDRGSPPDRGGSPDRERPPDRPGGRHFDDGRGPGRPPDRRADDGPPPAPTPQPAQELLLALGQDRGDVDRTMRELLSALCAAAAVMAAGTVLVVTTVVRLGLGPLRRLAGEAEQIDPRSLGQSFPVADLPRELQPICERLNRSLQRLEESFLRERRFTSDAAHELRTPIAELRASAEVALKWPDDAEVAARSLSLALEIAAHMERLVTTLLALARCESGQQAAIRRPVELSGVVTQAWEQHEGTAAARGHRVRLALPEQAWVNTDPALALSLVGNVLTNAVAYTPRGGAVECVLAASGPAVELRVANTCANLRAEDLPHVFEPFWRKDAARSDTSHSGLGLSLVSAYAGLLGLDVQAALPAENLFVFTARFPACPPPRDDGQESEPAEAMRAAVTARG